MAERPIHSAGVHHAYQRALEGATVRSRYVDTALGGRVHLLEKGDGAPVVLLHGTGCSAGFFLPLLDHLQAVHAVAIDLPGVGLSEPADLPRRGFRGAAVDWLDQVLDALELEATALVGHSGGGMWALWYALAHPERVTSLVLIGASAVPGTRCPLPLRMITTPGFGSALMRLAPPNRKSVLGFWRFLGERETLAQHPTLVDLLVALGRDPLTDRASRGTELRFFISPLALVSRLGFRRKSRIRSDELGQLAMPTLVVWGERETLGDVSVGQALAACIPQARLEVPPTGHVPWLGRPAETAALVESVVT
jgi:pimeloyl-ACP methyl ester carboxylesterase